LKRAPHYFDRIRRDAEHRWDQLESDPELAGPWHQLFKQVQSPRHIVSELLQNADDAGATHAHVYIDDGHFVFEHDGEDFTKEHFASLCRFGYSNKRALHTIGFRGIGFKSTFSLGEEVELHTPTLSVSFHKRRFTQPNWLNASVETEGRTRIRTAIQGSQRRKEVEKNLDEWLASAMSLLFFRNIRRLRVGDEDVHWSACGTGPANDSQWLKLGNTDKEPVLLVRSGEEAFPDDALEEIRNERMLAAGEDATYPPCRVEIVLGTGGRLYVVLPTGVETELPFACNAPFIQDPARMKIKDPATSPTNRWLLERVGRLAAEAMLSWLRSESLDLADRARAYELLPPVTFMDSGLDGACALTVAQAFADEIRDKDYLLCNSGELVAEGGCVSIPREVLEIWEPDKTAHLFDPESRPPLCVDVGVRCRKALVKRGAVESVSERDIIDVLGERSLPKPESWEGLLRLWAYLAPFVTDYTTDYREQELRILPAIGRCELQSADSVVRLGQQRLLRSERDWEFLSEYMDVLDHEWVKYLTDRKRLAEDGGSLEDKVVIKGAMAVLDELGLDRATDVDRVMNRVAARLFRTADARLEQCVQLAHIAVALRADAGAEFRFVTADGEVRAPSRSIVVDHDGALEELLPDTLRAASLLHRSYCAAFDSCTREEWVRWIDSGRAQLGTFVPLKERKQGIYGRNKLESEARLRGHQGELCYAFKTYDFEVRDWDFPADCWKHWETLAASDAGLWVRIAERIFQQREEFWKGCVDAGIAQVSMQRSKRVIASGLLPAWILRLRRLPCLPDTRGVPRRPEDLVCRTAETEALIDVEPFVHADFDREVNRPLLEVLGVRVAPSGPDRLLQCLRSLAAAANPPALEVEKWYRRLDRLVASCSTEDSSKVAEAFRQEPLILSSGGEWLLATQVFLGAGDDDVPDAPLMRPSVSDLALWHRVGVALRPTLDLALAWLKSLPAGTPLPQGDAGRVSSLMGKHPIRIWQEVEHWLNLAGEWTPVNGLKFSLSMQSLTAWTHLHPWVKEATADLRRVSAEITPLPPFAHLQTLSSVVDERFVQPPTSSSRSKKLEWLTVLASELMRIELASPAETEHVRTLATRLAATRWYEAPDLKIIPYIDGKPAGTPRKADVVWLDHSLFTEPATKAKLARRVPEEIGKRFAREDIKAALSYSYERSPRDVLEYLEENFSLAEPSPEPEPATSKATPPEDKGATAGSHSNEAAVDESPSDVSGDDMDASSNQLDGSPAEPAEPDLGAETVDGESTLQEHEDEQAVALRQRSPSIRTRQASIIERYALANGFKGLDAKTFRASDGRTIAQASERGMWEHYSSGGEITCHMWPMDHCLESEPLQLEASAWGLIESKPNLYALVLRARDGQPVLLTGARLRAMLDDKSITLYPATYRLVYGQDK